VIIQQKKTTRKYNQSIGSQVQNRDKREGLHPGRFGVIHNMDIRVIDIIW
jgi:hypothetical protein